LRLLVNIRGCNGAGKSTVPMSMMNDKRLEVIPLGEKNGKPSAPYITVFHSYMWVALGTYFNKTGGMDTLKNNEDTQKALYYAWTHYPDYDVLMEGIIASTIKSTYANLFTDYEYWVKTRNINPRRIIIMSFVPPIEVCLARVQERNGGKEVNNAAIISKWLTVNRNVDYFRQEGFISLRIDTNKCPKERMLHNFLKTCDKYRGRD